MRVAGLAATAILAGLTGCPADRRALSDQSGFQEDTLRQILVQHSELFDPFSVHFRRAKYQDGIWCGELNAKNRMGAYRGWTSFYVRRYSTGDATIWVASEEEGGFPQDSTVASMCRWANPERAAYYDSLRSDAAAVAARRERERQAHEAARTQALRDSLTRVQRLRDSLGAWALIATDRPSQILHCAKLVDVQLWTSIPPCLVSTFKWTRGEAETYWQYER